MSFFKHLKNYYPILENIFEIGAHRGYDIDEIVELWPNANIYAFEADPYNYDICLQRCKKYNNVHIFNLAIYDTIGTMSFNRFCNIENIPDSETFNGSNFQFTGCGSLNKPGFGLKNIYNIKEVTQEINVNTTTLYDFCNENNINSIDALFMDVQGAEMNVINGCKNLIMNTKGLILEWSTEYLLYENETDFNLIKIYLENIVNLKEVIREYQLQDINGDSLFVRLES